MESAETIELIKAAVEMIAQVLGMSTGLSSLARKIVAYYVLATHTVPKTNTFPLLVLIGPMGTGKSQTARVMKAFAYRSRSSALRGMSPPACRDELVECNDGTAVIEESDMGWKGESKNYENLLSDRYNRDTAEIFVKIPAGDGSWITVRKVFYGATVLHRRLKFADAALEGRSITVNFKPVHNQKYKDFSETDPSVVELKKRLQTFTFDPPELVRSFEAAGRILASFTPILAVAEMCGDEEFLAQMEASLATKTDQLKEDQSIEPDGLVVRALVDQLSTSGGLVFHNVKVKDLKASIFHNSAEEIHATPTLGQHQNFGPRPRATINALDRLSSLTRVIRTDARASRRGMSKGEDVRPTRLLGVVEAAQLLGCSARTIYGWVSQGRIPYRKAGRRVLFVESEILEWTKPDLDRHQYLEFIK